MHDMGHISLKSFYLTISYNGLGEPCLRFVIFVHNKIIQKFLSTLSRVEGDIAQTLDEGTMAALSLID